MFGLVTKEKYENMKKLYEDTIRYYKEDKRVWGSTLSDVIKCFDRYKKVNPNTVIIVEHPSDGGHIKIGDALIYEGMNHELVIDAE